MGKQIEGLEDHAHRAPCGVGVAAGVADIGTVEEHLSVVDVLEQVHTSQQRRFT